ncbi:MAG: hypothetical protein WDN23_10110 [Edaphobacter sp.]
MARSSTTRDSCLFREIRRSFQGNGRFLENFKCNGFYLDDLVLEPVNHLDNKNRRLLCRESVLSFVDRLKLYKPKAIVILLYSIKPMVLEAMREAGISYDPFCTPYPGFGNQPRFRKAMAEIIPNLPVARGTQWKEYHT